MPDDLARLSPAGAKAHAVNHVVQPALEPNEQVFAGDAFLVRSFFKPVAELPLQQPVDPAQLLLLAKLQAVADELGLAIFAMLSRNEVALFNSAFLAMTALSF